jgi:hypothetical protein
MRWPGKKNWSLNAVALAGRRNRPEIKRLFGLKNLVLAGKEASLWP